MKTHLEHFDRPQDRVQKAMGLLDDIEELATHIEDADVMRRWVKRIAASRHSEVFNVRVMGRVRVTPQRDDVKEFRESLKKWQRSLAVFVGALMKERPASTDAQLQAKFAEWEKANPVPDLKE